MPFARSHTVLDSAGFIAAHGPDEVSPLAGHAGDVPADSLGGQWSHCRARAGHPRRLCRPTTRLGAAHVVALLRLSVVPGVDNLLRAARLPQPTRLGCCSTDHHGVERLLVKGHARRAATDWTLEECKSACLFCFVIVCLPLRTH